MKICTLFFGFVLLNFNLFGQNDMLELSGAWCTEDLKLELSTNKEIKILSWELDGVQLKKVKQFEIDCTKFGPGLYTVNYKIDGEKKSLSSTIEKADPFTVDFSAEFLPAAAVTYFTDLSSVSDDQIIEWHWNFSDGTESTEQNPKIMFDEREELEVTLLIRTKNGCEYIVTKNHLANNY